MISAALSNSLPSNANIRRQTSLPAALGWPAAYVVQPALVDPGGMQKAFGSIGQSATAVKDVFNTFSTAFVEPDLTYWVRTDGNNANSGLVDSAGGAFRSIHTAITAGNATTSPFRVNVRAGEYARINGFSNDGTPVVATRDVAFVAYGAVQTGAWTSLTWSANGTYSWVQQATRSNAERVIHWGLGAALNPDGSNAQYTQVDSLLECSRSRLTWFTDGTTVFVNRGVAGVASDANTKVPVNNANYQTTTGTPVNTYIGSVDELSKFEFYGGSTNISLIYNTAPAAARAIVLERVASYYAGGNATPGARAFAIDGLCGLALLSNCTGNFAGTDAFNFHNTANLTAFGGLSWITVNCTSAATGGSQASCNSLTSHGTCVGFDVGSNFTGSAGGTVVTIGTSKTYLLGTLLGPDRGDLNISGGAYHASVLALESALILCEGVKPNISGVQQAYNAGTVTSTISLRNCVPTNGGAGGVGTINTF